MDMDRDDYALWRAWWYAALLHKDQEPSRRMRAIDKLRGIKAARHTKPH